MGFLNNAGVQRLWQHIVATFAKKGETGTPLLNAESTDGVAYTATLNGVTSLFAGLAVTIIPNMTTTSTTPTLNLNGLGAKTICRKLSIGTASTAPGYDTTMFYKENPVTLQYNGTYWMATEFTKPCASDLYGTVAVEKGGTGASTAGGAAANLSLVQYTMQTLTDDQKTQARENIGAVKSWNDLTDRPFGETYSDTLTWDGNTDGRVSVNGSYCKISDVVLTLDDVSSGITYRFGSELYKATPDLIYEWDGAVFVNNDDSEAMIMFVSPEGAGGNFHYPEPGIYVCYIGGEFYISSITIPGYTGFPSVKKLDAKYLPESVESVVVRSSTEGSTKKLEITADDSGMLSVTDKDTDVTTSLSDMIGSAPASHTKGITTEGDGDAYTATVDGITALEVGISFTMIPHVTTTSLTPTLNVNGLGAKELRRPTSSTNGITYENTTGNWLYGDRPIQVTYNGTYWVVTSLTRPDATDLIGKVRVEHGGTNASDPSTARKNLGIQCGTSESQNVGSSSVEDRTVTFPIAYAEGTTPVVLVSFTSGSSAANFGRLNIAVASASNTEFTCRIFNSDSSTRVPGFNWIAIGTPI